MIRPPGIRLLIADDCAAMRRTLCALLSPIASDILEATKLVEPGTKETLKFTAPKEEGDYEYVCTFPGHFMVMWGKLAVVKDVDAYLQANPVAVQPAPGAAPAHVHQQ